MSTLRNASTLSLILALFGAACGPESDPALDPDQAENEEPFTSELATLMDFSFDGELYAPSSSGAQGWIEDQMLYSIGQLNGSRSVGRLDALQILNLSSTREGAGYRIRYHAVLPVAWGSKTNLPANYEFILPRDMNGGALESFTTRYLSACADPSAHEVDAGSFWYYYRPSNTACRFDAADVVRISATARSSTQNTNNKYPEYHRVWEDQMLIMVAIFGKYEDGATTTADAGIAAFNSFVSRVRTELGSAVVTTPANLSSTPGVDQPDVTLEVTRSDGRRVRIHVLLVDNVRTAGAAFDARYAALSTEADLIAYNGHAGLGSNVRALARKGQFRAGKYQIVFMNGCDTFAYVDGALAESRARLNPDDPTGTRYMEIVTNARPSYFASNASNDLALIRGLLAYNAPLSYQQIFRNIDSKQVVVVTGEEDNVYVPGYVPGGGGGNWTGLNERGAVASGEQRRYTTPELPSGSYTVTLRHDPAAPGGDADLYVRAGAAPSSSSYDCRPYAGGSDEDCRVTLTAPAAIHIMVEGYGAAANAYVLTAARVGGGGGPTPWAGMNQEASVTAGQAVRFETPSLAAGRYSFVMSGDGDADLYVRAGTAPTEASYDCRPYRGDSAERCDVTLPAAAVVHIMVRGYAASSSFTLVGRPE